MSKRGPKKGSAAYQRKLERANARRQRQRDAAFAKTRRGKRLTKRIKDDVCKESAQEADGLRARSNRHMNAAAMSKKEASWAKASSAHAAAKLKQETSRADKAEAKVKSLQEELAQANKEKKALQKTALGWGWVLAKVSVGEARRLRRLAETPPRNRDRCWGGGQ